MMVVVVGNNGDKVASTLWLKTGHCIIGNNFVKCEPIFTNFALLQRKLNFQSHVIFSISP